jgi:hypothetical protein
MCTPPIRLGVRVLTVLRSAGRQDDQYEPAWGPQFEPHASGEGITGLSLCRQIRREAALCAAAIPPLRCSP